METPNCPFWAASAVSSRISPTVKGMGSPSARCRLAAGSASIASSGAPPRSSSARISSAATVVFPVPPLPANAMVVVIPILSLGCLPLPYLGHARKTLDLGMRQEERGRECVVESVVRRQLHIGHAVGDLHYLLPGLVGEQGPGGSQHRGVPQEMETVPGQIRQQPDLHRLLHVDVLAQGAAHQHLPHVAELHAPAG